MWCAAVFTHNAWRTLPLLSLLWRVRRGVVRPCAGACVVVLVWWFWADGCGDGCSADPLHPLLPTLATFSGFQPLKRCVTFLLKSCKLWRPRKPVQALLYSPCTQPLTGHLFWQPLTQHKRFIHLFAVLLLWPTAKRSSAPVHSSIVLR